MFDLQSARKQQLVELVRDLQARRHATIVATSTLLRQRSADLAALIVELCSDDYRVSDAGRVSAVRRSSKPADAVPPRPGRALFAGDTVITVQQTENPKREGSASHARYAMLRSGMTVAEYLAAAGPRGGRTLREAVRQGHVRVVVTGD